MHGSCPRITQKWDRRQEATSHHARHSPSRVENDNIHHMPNVVKQSTAVSIHVGTLWHKMKKSLLIYWKLCSIILVASRYMFYNGLFSLGWATLLLAARSSVGFLSSLGQKKLPQISSARSVQRPPEDSMLLIFSWPWQFVAAKVTKASHWFCFFFSVVLFFEKADFLNVILTNISGRTLHQPELKRSLHVSETQQLHFNQLIVVSWLQSSW